MASFKKPRTVVPGIDGVPYSLLQEKFDQGEMPNLAFMEIDQEKNEASLKTSSGKRSFIRIIHIYFRQEANPKSKILPQNIWI